MTADEIITMVVKRRTEGIPLPDRIYLTQEEWDELAPKLDDEAERVRHMRFAGVWVGVAESDE